MSRWGVVAALVALGLVAGAPALPVGAAARQAPQPGRELAWARRAAHPRGEPAGYEQRLTVSYWPQEGWQVSFDGNGQPRLGRIVAHTLTVSQAVRAELTASTALLARLTTTLVTPGAPPANGPDQPAAPTAAPTHGAAVGLEYRPASLGPVDPALSAEAIYPEGMRVSVRGEILRDPVILSAALTYSAARHPPAGRLAAALGLGLLANDRVSLAAWAVLAIPSGSVGEPGPVASLEGRAGYTLDPEGEREVTLRVGVQLLSGQAAPLIGLEWAARRRAQGRR